MAPRWPLPRACRRRYRRDKGASGAGGVSDAALAAYRLVDALMRDHHLPDEIYTRAIASLGEDGVVAAVQIAGHYVTVFALLRAFHVAAPSA